jgi:chorismate mutase
MKTKLQQQKLQATDSEREQKLDQYMLSINQHLQRLDYRVLGLLARRMRIVRDNAAYRCKRGLSKEPQPCTIENYIAYGKTLGLPEDLVTSVMCHVSRSSSRLERDVRESYTANHLD